MSRTCELCRNTLCMDVNEFSGRVKIKDGYFKRIPIFIEGCDIRVRIKQRGDELRLQIKNGKAKSEDNKPNPSDGETT